MLEEHVLMHMLTNQHRGLYCYIDFSLYVASSNNSSLILDLPVVFPSFAACNLASLPFDGRLLQFLPWTNGIAGTVFAHGLWWELWDGSVSSSGILGNRVRTVGSLDHTVRLPVGIGLINISTLSL